MGKRAAFALCCLPKCTVQLISKHLDPIKRSQAGKHSAGSPRGTYLAECNTQLYCFMGGPRSPNSHFKSFNFCSLYPPIPHCSVRRELHLGLECYSWSGFSPNYSGKFNETMAAVPLRLLLVPFFTTILGEAQYVMQDATLLHYIDRRILSIEVCAIL